MEKVRNGIMRMAEAIFWMAYGLVWISIVSVFVLLTPGVYSPVPGEE